LTTDGDHRLDAPAVPRPRLPGRAGRREALPAHDVGADRRPDLDCRPGPDQAATPKCVVHAVVRRHRRPRCRSTPWRPTRPPDRGTSAHRAQPDRGRVSPLFRHQRSRQSSSGRGSAMGRACAQAVREVRSRHRRRRDASPTLGSWRQPRERPQWLTGTPVRMVPIRTGPRPAAPKISSTSRGFPSVRWGAGLPQLGTIVAGRGDQVEEDRPDTVGEQPHRVPVDRPGEGSRGGGVVAVALEDGPAGLGSVQDMVVESAPGDAKLSSNVVDSDRARPRSLSLGTRDERPSRGSSVPQSLCGSPSRPESSSRSGPGRCPGVGDSRGRSPAPHTAGPEDHRTEQGRGERRGLWHGER
jgi:hypothetical protein